MKINKTQNANFLLFIFSFIFLLNWSSANALIISEIQFDPSGTDSDREWLEVYNDESATIDFSKYKFFENGENHGLTALGSSSLLPGEYTLIIQDLTEFNKDFPSNTFKLFKSSFNLLNTGEALSIKNNSGTVVDSYTYNPGVTNSGNGYSEQLVSGSWGTGLPTPGAANVFSTPPSAGGGSTGTSTASSTSTGGGSSVFNPVYTSRASWPSSEKIYVQAGENKIALTGSEIILSAKVLDGDKKDISSSAQYAWSFGDGSSDDKKEVKKIYKLSGEYAVSLEVKAGNFIQEDKVYIKVVDADLSLRTGSERGVGYSEITNNNNEEINLSSSTLKQLIPEKIFTFPKSFSLLGKRTIRILNEYTGFTATSSPIVLYSSNGMQLAQYGNINTASSSAASSTATGTPGIILLPLASSTSPAANIIRKQTVKNYKNINLVNNLASTNTLVSFSDKTATQSKVIINKQREGIWQSFKSTFGIK